MIKAYQPRITQIRPRVLFSCYRDSILLKDIVKDFLDLGDCQTIHIQKDLSNQTMGFVCYILFYLYLNCPYEVI